MENFLELLKIIIYFALSIIGLLMFAFAIGKGSSGGDSWAQKVRERYELKESIKEQQEKRIQRTVISYPASCPVRSNSSRSNYSVLWDECEDLESILSDANIDHDEMNYPMDYNELEDLRDEYQSLLEENNVDY